MPCSRRRRNSAERHSAVDQRVAVGRRFACGRVDDASGADDQAAVDGPAGFLHRRQRDLPGIVGRSSQPDGDLDVVEQLALRLQGVDDLEQRAAQRLLLRRVEAAMPCTPTACPACSRQMWQCARSASRMTPDVFSCSSWHVVVERSSSGNSVIDSVQESSTAIFSDSTFESISSLD